MKIHWASYARYFENFLKFVEYERLMPEVEEVYEKENEERLQLEKSVGMQAASMWRLLNRIRFCFKKTFLRLSF